MDQTLSDYFIILSMEKRSAQNNRWVKIDRARSQSNYGRK